MVQKAMVIQAGRRMLEEGLTVDTWGNISCRHGDRVYITPSGRDYRTMEPEHIVVLDLQGAILEGNLPPSMELGLHLAIYQARPAVKAIIHTHALYSNIFACTGTPLPLFHDEGAQTLGDTVQVAAYAPPGSSELAAACVTALGQTAHACLLRSHGAVCVAPTMQACFRVATVLEMMAELYYRIKAMGQEPLPLPEKYMEGLRQLGASRNDA